MKLDKLVQELGHKHPQGSQTLVLLELNQIQTTYGAGHVEVGEYLSYKYQTEKPKGFLLWYVDIYKPAKEIEKHYGGMNR